MESHLAHLGGVFIYSEDPETLGEWYKRAFGLDWEYAKEYGAWFITFPYSAEKDKSYTIFSILKTASKPKIEATSEDAKGKLFTINLRVKNCRNTYERLTSLGIECSEPKDYPGEGVFAWLQDPEGNYLELWEDKP